ncbi:hypothetical protein [Vibrio maerlii]|uniref:hypothetical protein n=1 Tax=Vibrio maerlii TaxID=2231648 RepID=UPI000E3D1633|nr:hypothetical protein [Vibrio maerlii]
MNFKNSKTKKVVLATALMTAPTLGLANDTNTQDDWAFDVEAYSFLVNIDGDAGIGRKGNMLPESEVDVPFSDVVDMLESTLMVHTEGLYKNTWGYILDYSYMDLSEGGSVVGLANSNYDVDVFQGALTAKGFRRYPQSFGHIDLVAGLRWWQNKIDLAVDVDALGLHSSRSLDVDWVDYVVGTRVQYNINNKWRYYFDIDAGIGKDTEFTSELQTGFKREFKNDSYLRLGFKSTYVNYNNKEKFSYDTNSWGLVIGYGMHF